MKIPILKADDFTKAIAEKTKKQQTREMEEIKAEYLEEVKDTKEKEVLHEKNDIFEGKPLAASYDGYTISEMMKKPVTNERRDRSKRQILTKEEQNRLSTARRTLKEMHKK